MALNLKKKKRYSLLFKKNNFLLHLIDSVKNEDFETIFKIININFHSLQEKKIMYTK